MKQQDIGSIFKACGALMRLSRPVGFFLLLWPTLIALFFASPGLPSLRNIVIFSLGTFTMRALGCVINDCWDRNFDGQVARTKQRPLVSHTIALHQALLLIIGLGSINIFIAWQLNALCWHLTIYAAMLCVIYPLMKRWVSMPQLILGLAFAMGGLMAYAEVQGQLGLESWMVFTANCLWVIAYDTQYALCDLQDDIKLGLKSSARYFGAWDKLIILGLQALALLLFGLLAYQHQMSGFFYVSLVIALVLCLHQQQLIKYREPKACLQAFNNNAYLGLVLVLGLVIEALRLKWA